MIHLDTHVAIWLYSDPMHAFPARVSALIEKEDLQYCPIVALEIQMNYEIGRIKSDSRTILSYLENQIGLVPSKESFSPIAQSALYESWTRDPFDRIIVSHAKLNQVRLITKDAMIRKHYPKAVWD